MKNLLTCWSGAGPPSAPSPRILAWHRGRVPVYVRDPEDVIDTDADGLPEHPPAA